ncbi:uncharacterized protein LOC115669832 [Syzygium oleosum]|uniref:uncharacterized protein LOC115669832 n=1 Tax=Syzygium oleosum TaxID=219896 RepID=UPI0024BA8A10|nr:uncharacterized protein LOC115669832 [Syzygium oleosum]
MAEQRQPLFRFRVPWLSGTSASRARTGTQPPRPTNGSTAPSQPTASTSVPRPPFRPAGIAQPPPPSPPSPPARVPTPPRPLSQPQSPPIPRAAPDSTIAPKLEEPTLMADRPQAASSPPRQSSAVPRIPPTSPQVQKPPEVTLQPQSPIPAAPVASAASQPTTPTLARPQLKAPSLPPSPSPKPSSRGPFLPRSGEETVAEPQPSLLAPEPPKETLPQTSSPAQKATPPLPESAASLPPPPAEKSLLQTPISQPPLEPPPKAEIKDESISRPGNDYTIEAPAKRDATTMQVSPLTRSATANIAKIEPPPQSERLDPMSTRGVHPGLSGKVSEEAKEAKNDEEQFPKQERIRSQDSEETLQGTLTAGSRLDTQTKEPPTVPSPGEQKQKQETPEVASATTASGSRGKHTKALKSTQFPKGRHMVSESHDKPVASRGEQSSLPKEIREEISKLVHKLTTGQTQRTPDDKPISTTTMAGENRGALMQLTLESAKREGSIHIHRGYKTDPDESLEAPTDTEGSSKQERHEGPKTEQEPGTEAFINSNVQTVNNSMVFESSISARNPGVQMELSPDIAEEVEPSNQTETPETRKAEFSLTPSEKLTYEPTIRRRCLRGLLLESSDSDPDNTAKPRRHGCRYSCGGTTKEKDANVP